jgi:adenylate cyclase
MSGLETAPHEKSERRLAAILVADVVGYSRLMERDDEGTLARLQHISAGVIEPKVAEHRGRIFRTMGDGLLIEFPSVVEAVTCAVEIQRQLGALDSDEPPERRVQLRIGVNVGDVIRKNNDVFGTGVNIAARLESLAEPGSVYISGEAYDHIRDRPFAFDDLGMKAVKNIARLVRVYRVRDDDATPVPQPPMKRQTRTERLALLAALLVILLGFAAERGWWPWPTLKVAPSPPRLSIVVLPFENLSKDPQQDYLADGITEDLTTDLSRVSGSFVIGRNTAFTYKGKPLDLRKLGQELNVRYVLEGSVLRIEKELRVNVQLIDAETGRHLWADRFDHDLTNVLKLHDEVTTRIAYTLGLVLRKDAGSRPIIGNADAIDFLLRASAVRQGNRLKEGTNQAIALYEKAITIDPTSVPGISHLSSLLSSRVINGWSDARSADIKRAGELSERALALDPSNESVRSARAEYFRAVRRPDLAIGQFESVIRLDPNAVDALSELGRVKTFVGEPEATIVLVSQAMRLSPRDPATGSWQYWMGYAHLLLGDGNEAIHWLEMACDTTPGVSYFYFYLAAAYGYMDRVPEARAALQKAYRLNPSEQRKISDERAGGQSADRKYFELRDRTIIIGLRKAGMPE